MKSPNRRAYPQPPAVMPDIWSKKHQFCQTTLFYGPKKKSIGYIFSDYSRKKQPLSCPYFVGKRPFRKTHTFLKPICCHKKIPFSQKQCALMSFLQIFIERPPAVKSIFGPKNANFVKTTLYYGPKKSIGCLFFSDFPRKNNYSHTHIL